jgi:hypothetical protein
MHRNPERERIEAAARREAHWPRWGPYRHQGNHGEDVKEYWWYLDAVPSHAYLKALYRYPQRAFLYALLRERNATRGRGEREYELVDTGIFAGDAYFDISVEYAKRDVDDILVRIAATNRGNEPAPLHLLPQLWFRNEWSWKCGTPRARVTDADATGRVLVAEHATLGKRWIFNGDTGEGLGASHQTGWTGLVAKLIDQLAAYRGKNPAHVAADFDVIAEP